MTGKEKKTTQSVSSGLKKYLLWTFAIAWVLQIAASWFSHSGNTIVYQILLMVSMFVPLAAVVLSGISLKNMGWKPALKGKVRFVLAAWFFPAILGTIGAVLFYLLLPGAFDPSSSYIVSVLGKEGLKQMTSQGISVPIYAIISTVAAVTVAPFMNMFAAIGEEAGSLSFNQLDKLHII